MNLQVGVKILLHNEEGKYLLLERNLEKYPVLTKAQKWDLVGGRINVGTSLLENLKREILEETKLTLESEPRLIAAQDIFWEDKQVVRLTYTAAIQGDPVLDEDHVSYKWLTPAELKNLEDLDPYAKEVLELL